MSRRNTLLTSQQVANRLLCSTESVRRMCEAGRFDGDPSRGIPPASRAGPGAHWRIPAAAVDLQLEQARALVQRGRRATAGAPQQAAPSSTFRVNAERLVLSDPKSLTLDVVEQRLGALASELQFAADDQGEPVLFDYYFQLTAMVDARRSMVDDPDRGALFVSASKAAESHCERYNRGLRTLAHERGKLFDFVSKHLANVQAAYVQQGDAAARALAAGVAKDLAVYPRLRARTRYPSRADWYGPGRAVVAEEITVAVSKAIRAAKSADLVVTQIMRALGDDNADKLFDSDDDARTRRRR